MAEVVVEGQRGGELPSTVDPSDFAVRLSALIDGLAVQVVLGDREEDAQIVSGDGGRRTRVRPAGFLRAVSYL